MLKIRFQRTGKKHDAGYRIVVAENTAPIKWKFIEKLWSFMARKKADTLILNLERAKYWISVWAKPSDTVARLLVSQWLKEAEKFVAKRVMKPSKAELEAAKKKEEEEAKRKEEEEAKKKEEAAAAEKPEEAKEWWDEKTSEENYEEWKV